MARILAISSQVVRGHIGLSAAVPALQGLDHEVWPLPTILLSNHPGHAHGSGQRIEPEMLDQFIDALDRNGWLGEIDAVLTGYLPSPQHAEVAARTIRRLKSERPVYYLCDPVLGDEPKGLYIDATAAQAVRDGLVPLADAITPNRFELGWLSSAPVGAEPYIQADALSPETIIVTSAARRGHLLDNLMFTVEGSSQCTVAWHPDVPHGTGDFFAGLFLGHHLNGASNTEALARSAAGVEQAITASAGRDELILVPHQGWSTISPLPVEQL